MRWKVFKQQGRRHRLLSWLHPLTFSGDLILSNELTVWPPSFPHPPLITCEIYDLVYGEFFFLI